MSGPSKDWPMSTGQQIGFQASLKSKLALNPIKCAKILIWSLGLSILIGFTVKDVLELLQEYLENNFTMEVDVKVVGQNFKPPQFLVRIPYYRKGNEQYEILWEIANASFHGKEDECEPCRKLKKVGWDVWNEVNLTKSAEFGVRETYQALSLAFARKLYKNIETAENVLSANSSSWNEPIFNSALNFFLWISDSDYHGGQAPDLDPGLSKAIDDFDDTKKVDLLFSQTLKAICRLIIFKEQEFENVNANTSSATCETFLLNSTSTVFIGVTGLWLVVPDLDTLFRKVYTWTLLPSADSSNSSIWIPKDIADTSRFRLYPDTSASYVGFYTRRMYSSHLYEVPDNFERLGHYMTVSYSLQMRAVEKRAEKLIPGPNACHNERSATVCYNKCAKKWMIRKCGCVPFSVKAGLRYDPNLPYCTPSVYDVCKPLPVPDEEKEICMAKCDDICEYYVYNVKVDHSFYDPDKPNTVEYTLDVSPSYASFVEFSWVKKNSLTVFFSQLGGSIGGYLGLDGVSFLVLTMYCIDFLRRRQKRKDDQQESELKGQKFEIRRSTVFDGIGRRGEGNLRAGDVAGLAAMIEDMRSQVEEMRREFKSALKTVEKRLDRWK